MPFVKFDIYIFLMDNFPFFKIKYRTSSISASHILAEFRIPTIFVTYSFNYYQLKKN